MEENKKEWSEVSVGIIFLLLYGVMYHIAGFEFTVIVGMAQIVATVTMIQIKIKKPIDK